MFHRLALLYTQAAPGKPWAYAGYKVTVYSNNEEMLNDLLWWDSVPKVRLRCGPVLLPSVQPPAACYSVHQGLLHTRGTDALRPALHRSTAQGDAVHRGPR